MQFAFYGRASTEDQQDPEASRNWQLIRAKALVEKHVVRLAWSCRRARPSQPDVRGAAQDAETLRKRSEALMRAESLREAWAGPSHPVACQASRYAATA
jgi:hypothetical protein